MKPRNHDLGCMVTGTHLFQHKRRRFAGDLLDKYNRRRSAAWYWRQVLIGIVTSCASGIRHHRRRATQARRHSAWACFVRHQPSRRPREWVDCSIAQPQTSQRCALDQRRILARRGLLEWALFNRISSSASFITWLQCVDLRLLESFSPGFPKTSTTAALGSAVSAPV